MSDWKQETTIVSVNLLVFRDGKILLGKRIGGQASDQWGTPSGRLEYMEGIEACAHRELYEETGITVGPLTFSSVVNVPDYPPRHVVLITFVADWKSGEAQILEPTKCAAWEWFDVNTLPEPLTVGTYKSIEGYQTGRAFFDAP